MQNLPSDTERHQVEDQLPVGMERRLVLRVLAYWRDLCGERKFPSFADVDPAQIPDMWPQCFVLDVAGHAEDPVFRSVGRELAEFDGGDLSNRRVSEAPEATLIRTAVGYVGDVLVKNVPISRGGEFFRPDGARVLYRSILLPMSDDGETVSGLLGAANCRVVTEEEERG